MAFKEVNDLSCDITISLGGTNKKTGKPNPAKIEGYYLGSSTVEDKKKKSGVSYIYAFKTAKGNVGVWGKTDLDRKMAAATVGSMTRLTHTGFRETPNGDMYTYKVEVDSENTIDVQPPVAVTKAANNDFSEDDAPAYASYESDETDVDAEETPADEVVVARPAAPRNPIQAPDAARTAKVQALLNSSRNKTG